MSFDTLHFRNTWRKAQNLFRDIQSIQNDIYQMVFAALHGKEDIIQKLEYQNWSNYDGPQAHQVAFQPRELKTVAQDITDNRDTSFLKEILGDTNPDVLPYIKFRLKELDATQETLDHHLQVLGRAAFSLLESKQLLLKE